MLWCVPARRPEHPLAGWPTNTTALQADHTITLWYQYDNSLAYLSDNYTPSENSPESLQLSIGSQLAGLASSAASAVRVAFPNRLNSASEKTGGVRWVVLQHCGRMYYIPLKTVLVLQSIRLSKIIVKATMDFVYCNMRPVVYTMFLWLLAYIVLQKLCSLLPFVNVWHWSAINVCSALYKLNLSRLSYTQKHHGNAAMIECGTWPSWR